MQCVKAKLAETPRSGLQTSKSNGVTNLVHKVTQAFVVVALLLSSLLSCGTAQAQSKMALVLGNSKYSNLPALVNPANDALLLSENLQKLGFTVTALTDQTQSQMKSAIAQFTQSVTVAGGDAIALLYFAGHGVQINGTNYLIPVDANLNTAGDVVLGAVSANDLLKTMELAGAKVNVLVLDACRDNPFKSTTRGMSRGLARVEAPAGSIVAYATAPGQVAADGDGSNSPYAEALSKNLAIPGLALESVFRQVRIEVSEKTGGIQVPWEETSLTQEVVLAGPASSAPALEPIAAAAPDTLSTRAYQLAVGMNTVEAYDAFLTKFPSGKEAALALRNIEMLNDETNWNKATTANTVGAYRMYLALHAEGAYVKEAQQRLSALTNTAVAEPLEPVTAAVVEPVVPKVKDLVAQVGFDVFGDDLEPLRDMTFESCQNACAATDTCVAVSFRADLNRCYPKSTAVLAVRNAKVSYAIKYNVLANLRVSRFEFLPQADVTGTEYSEAKAQTPQDCLEICEKDKNCAAFSYAVSNKVCYFKSSIADVIASPKVVSGVRRE
jgi:uncharacterized caspase-like protein